MLYGVSGGSGEIFLTLNLYVCVSVCVRVHVSVANTKIHIDEFITCIDLYNFGDI